MTEKLLFFFMSLCFYLRPTSYFLFTDTFPVIQMLLPEMTMRDLAQSLSASTGDFIQPCRF